MNEEGARRPRPKERHDEQPRQIRSGVKKAKLVTDGNK